jgi:glycosyltransferase involved in cell wall biosynthesis
MEHLLLHHALVGDTDRLAYEAAYLVERPNSVRPKLEEAGVTCHALGGQRTWDVRWLIRLVALVRRERIDVVHVHSPLIAAMARPVLRVLPHRPKIVYTEHNSWETYRPGTRWANRLTYGLDDARIAVSDEARASAPACRRRRTEVIVHGIDVGRVRAEVAGRGVARRDLDVGADDLVVGIVANLRPAKNYPRLLRAARSIVDSHPTARFVSLGQGPLAGEVEELRDELGLGDRFRFLGFRADAPHLMAGFDIFTLSSDTEGLPVAIMEAKALGLPVVATAVGGIPQAVTDGIDGRLVPPGDSASLAAALAEVLDDPELRARLGAGSAASADRYDARVAAQRIDEIYLDVTA